MKKILTAVLLAFSILACKGKEEAKGPKTEGLKGSIVVQAEDTWQPYYEAATIPYIYKRKEDIE